PAHSWSVIPLNFCRGGASRGHAPFAPGPDLSTCSNVRGQICAYSITSSATASSDGGVNVTDAPARPFIVIIPGFEVVAFFRGLRDLPKDGKVDVLPSMPTARNGARDSLG